jgi:hypothetical protein
MPQRYDRFWLHDKQQTCVGAEVWRASMGADPYTHSFYVRLLRIPLQLPQGRNLFERTCQQAVLCKAIRHPHILQVYAWGEAEDIGWVAVEHTDGYNLDALVQTLRRQRLRIPVPLAVHIVMQALRSLDFLHQHRLVHGAVHAGGLFLGSHNHVKLATPTGDLPFGFHAPAIGVLAAPQVAGAVGAPRGDVWQAAQLLQSLLAAHDIDDAFVQTEAPLLVPLVPAVPVALAQVLQRVLAPRHRHQRIADAATLYRHLAFCEVADAMAGCAPLLRYWVQTAAPPSDISHQVGAAPAWTQAPMRALFGAPKHPPRRKSRMPRVMRA